MLFSVEVLNVITLFVCFCSKCAYSMESFPEGNMIWRFECFLIVPFPWGNIYDSAVSQMFSFHFGKKFVYEVWL